MAVNFIDIDSGAKYSQKRALKEWIKGAIKREGRVCEDLTIALCSDSYILEQNIASLGHNYATDILTFEYNEDEIISGDLLISTDTVRSNAKEYNVTFETELHRVMIHGVLHLIGYYDHSDEDRAKMREMENLYLDIFEKEYSQISQAKK